MCLVEDGLLGLNRPVQQYLPEFVGEGKEAVMVHHLLTHTSGLRDEDLDAYALARIRTGQVAAPEPVPGLGPFEFLHMRCFDSLHDAPLGKAPGAEMSYCSYGYCLLTEIVTRVAGQPADVFARERIFDPLGMTATSFTGLPAERLDCLVRRADEAPFASLNQPDMNGWRRGAGAAYSTALDLAVFTQTFLNGGGYGGARVLSRATIVQATRNQIPGIISHWAGEYFPEASWGYGWDVQGDKEVVQWSSLLSPAAFSHSGASMSVAWADPAYDLVGVYLSVLPRRISRWRRGDWQADLFANAVVASIVD